MSTFMSEDAASGFFEQLTYLHLAVLFLLEVSLHDFDFQQILMALLKFKIYSMHGVGDTGDTAKS